MGPQLACGHVLDHALTQRADGGIGTHGELLLSEVTKTSIFPQDGAPRPTTVSSRLATQPSIGYPAHRLSRQRFSALARTHRSVRCSDSVCFLRVFCRVDNAVGRRTLDPNETSAYALRRPHHRRPHTPT